MTHRLGFAAAAAVGVVTSASGQNILVPESGDNTVYLINGFDGSVINSSFISIADAASAAGYTGSTTPVEAIEVGNEIWVSDQLADRIWTFDRSGNYTGQIGVDSFGDGQLNNIRGIEVVGDTVYASLGNNNAAGTVLEGIATIDVSTRQISGGFNGRDAVDTNYFDVLAYNGELLVTNIDTGNDGVERYDLAGNFLGSLIASDGATGVDFAQQITARSSNGNLLVGGFSPPSGVYEYLPDGTSLGIVAGLDFGPRAGYELGNGSVVWSNGSFLRTDAETFANGSFRFFSPTSVPAPASAALLSLGGLAAARRRR
ncbi:MAG: hypothetical protein AAFR96_03345 [Planctomycetota bacterium]